MTRLNESPALYDWFKEDLKQTIAINSALVARFPLKPKPFTMEEYLSERCPSTSIPCGGCKYLKFCRIILKQ